MTWGKDQTDDKIAAAAQECGYAIPETVQDQPTVELWDEIYWCCFMDLCGCRPMGYSLGYIPWTAIHEWAKRYGIDDADSFSVLQRMVTALDVVWVDHYSAK